QSIARWRSCCARPPSRRQGGAFDGSLPARRGAYEVSCGPRRHSKDKGGSPLAALHHWIPGGSDRLTRPARSIQAERMPRHHAIVTPSCWKSLAGGDRGRAQSGARWRAICPVDSERRSRSLRTYEPLEHLQLCADLDLSI